VTVTGSGITAAQSLGYSVAGPGCASGTSGTLNFDTTTTAQVISVALGAAAGTCTVSLINPPSGSSNVWPINVVSGIPPPPTNGCPTPDPNSLAVNISTNALPQTQATGVIGYAPVASPSTGKASVYFEQSIGTTTANAMHTEISVSPCPGVILTPSTQPAVATQCYVSTDYTVDNRLYIYTKPVFSWTSQAALGNRGCWAGDGKTYFVNYRWTYGGCAYGTCGFVLQWFTGPY